MITLIKDRNDVITFFRQLIEEGTNAHPDEDFNNYINTITGDSTYSAAEADLRNKLMNMCFDICGKSGDDVYDLMQKIYLEETGLNNLI